MVYPGAKYGENLMQIWLKSVHIKLYISNYTFFQKGYIKNFVDIRQRFKKRFLNPPLDSAFTVKALPKGYLFFFIIFFVLEKALAKGCL